ncbi:hypothetical protein [Bacillus sp. ISL-55]|uniref:hypothetical protein n=1 Tax=Bacillus sp. ISL-55 TaxID=2819134 RepID=UPI001BEB7158|nr:hypothetical protein [Bacillus sp. ISL-55]
MSIDPSYIEKTESYIEQNKESMDQNVYSFIKQVCQDERKYLELVEQWGKQKGVRKVSEPKLMPYPNP